MTWRWRVNVALQAAALFLIVLEPSRLLGLLALSHAWPQHGIGAEIVVTFVSMLLAANAAAEWIERERRLLIERLRRR